jgi:hypothetical protein
VPGCFIILLLSLVHFLSNVIEQYSLDGGLNQGLGGRQEEGRDFFINLKRNNKNI